MKRSRFRALTGVLLSVGVLLTSASPVFAVEASGATQMLKLQEENLALKGSLGHEFKGVLLTVENGSDAPKTILVTGTTDPKEALAQAQKNRTRLLASMKMIPESFVLAGEIIAAPVSLCGLWGSHCSFKESARNYVLFSPYVVGAVLTIPPYTMAKGVTLTTVNVVGYPVIRAWDRKQDALSAEQLATMPVQKIGDQVELKPGEKTQLMMLESTQRHLKQTPAIEVR